MRFGAVKSAHNFFRQPVGRRRVIRFDHSFGKVAQFLTRKLPAACELIDKLDDPRLFFARQLLDFFNDGGGSHGLIIAANKFRARANVHLPEDERRMPDLNRQEAKRAKLGIGGAVGGR
jgi:hypothetical protein